MRDAFAWLLLAGIIALAVAGGWQEIHHPWPRVAYDKPCPAGAACQCSSITNSCTVYR